ncbi:MAG: hypothetical protein ACTH1D_09650 [Mycobacteriaceae bacterium]|uniref:hypothetical protein n=1 Tax=Corynebacterium sp. TaxID=1720 RepID=UPI003F990348
MKVTGNRARKVLVTASAAAFLALPLAGTAAAQAVGDSGAPGYGGGAVAPGGEDVRPGGSDGSDGSAYKPIDS